MQDAETELPAAPGGWRYEADPDHHEEQLVKLEHYAVHEQAGVRVNMDYTPYRHMDWPIFGKLVAMGFPPRPGPSPWDEASVIAAEIGR